MKILSFIYFVVTSIRNRLYDKQIFKIKKIEDLHIICIGNITAGGTGKTPAVQYFAKYYESQGIKTAVISRGYRGKRDIDPMVVSDGKNIFAKVEESGDESYLHAKNLNVPVIVGKNRYLACLLAKEKYNTKVVILDDGFQHRKLHRDTNVVLIDATNPFGNEELLPKGRLRESLDGLNRADCFIITKTDNVGKDEIGKIKIKLQKYNKKIFLSEYSPKTLKRIENNAVIEVEYIKDKRVLLFTSIANPKNFENSVKKFEPAYITNISKRDHAYFCEEDFDRIEAIIREQNIDMVLITEKDMVKLPDMFKNKEKFYVLGIEFKILESENVFG